MVGVDLADEASVNDQDSQYLYIKADVSKPDEMNKLPSKVKERFGQDVTLVISNAGLMIGQKVLDFEDGQFEK